MKSGAPQWRGLIEEYRAWLPVDTDTPVVTLREGGTPLVYACTLSEMTGSQVWLKYDGANPTGSFKDRGMTLALSKAVERGAQAVICASTGNTSAAAAGRKRGSAAPAATVPATGRTGVAPARSARRRAKPVRSRTG